MVVVLYTDVTIPAVPAVSRYNQSTFCTCLPLLLAEVISRLRNDSRIAECDYKIRERFSDADDCCDESEVDVVGGCKDKLDDEVADHAKEDESRYEAAI